MKTHDQKYKEAVARNLIGAETYKRECYVGKGLEEAKRRLGIRMNDVEYDERVARLNQGGI